VKVDHTRYCDSRLYTGAGIYRNVKLIKTNKLHVPVWGTFITTPEITPDIARVNIETKVRNCFPDFREFTLKTTVFSPDGLRLEVKEEQAGIEKDTVAERYSVRTSGILSQPEHDLWNIISDVENVNFYHSHSES
jgi:beta-galactosidase